MKNTTQSHAYLEDSIKSAVILAIYWGIIYFLYKSEYKTGFDLESLFAVIEVVAVIAIVIGLVLVVSNFFGSIIIGIIISIIIFAKVADLSNSFMAKHNLSDNFMLYILLFISLIFNIVIIVRFIKGIQNYNLIRYSEKYDFTEE